MRAKNILKPALFLAILTSAATTVLSAPAFYPGNGHYYEVIDGAFTWHAANTAATSSSFLGTFGHLVTVTDAAENLWLTSTYGVAGLELHWLGAVQPAGSPEPAGGWTWVTGEPFIFTNWFTGEPNNQGGDESRMVYAYIANANGKTWHDYGANGTVGYVVEYSVPEPMTATLMLATAPLFLMRRRTTSTRKTTRENG